MSFPEFSSARPTHLDSSPVRTIHQFPEGTWIENIAARSNGHLLVTLLTSPELYTIDPLSNPPTATPVYSFSGSTYNYTGLLGITEFEPDNFAFVAGAIPQTADPGFYSVWNADLSKGNTEVSKIADIPSGQLLNGICTLNSQTLLIADSLAGNLVKLDTRTGISVVLIDDSTMKPGTDDRGFTSGINGVKYSKATGYLYYSNSFLGNLFRVKVDCETAEVVSKIETVATGLSEPDDFFIAEDGAVYVAEGASNSIANVDRNGKVDVVAGSLNSTDVPGPTAVTSGRTREDRGTIYVSTNSSGSKVVALKG
jgi:sugar lactone lactonase YvrE